MITKEETIVILEAALANPNYLGTVSETDDGDDHTNWFCCSVIQVLRNMEAYTDLENDIQSHICEDYIYPSIDRCLFLKTHLINIGTIETDTWYHQIEYKIAARNHWLKVITDIKASI